MSGGGPPDTSPGSKRVARVILLPTSAIVEEGKNAILVAQAYNAAGKSLPNKTYDTPTTSDPVHVTLRVNGNQLIAHGVFEGNADVTCSCEGVVAAPRTVIVQAGVANPVHFESAHFDATAFEPAHFG